jgi:hypothetical protein
MKMSFTSFLNLRPGGSTCAVSTYSNNSFFYAVSKPINDNTVLGSIDAMSIMFCYFIIHHINNLAI